MMTREETAVAGGPTGVVQGPGTHVTIPIGDGLLFGIGEISIAGVSVRSSAAFLPVSIAHTRR